LNEKLLDTSTQFLIEVMDVFYAVLYLKFEGIRDNIKKNLKFSESFNISFPITEEISSRALLTKNDIATIAHEISKIPPTDHKQIQSEIEKVLKNKFNFSVLREHKIPLGTSRGAGYIDLVAKRGNCVIGIEIDRATPKYKSIEKLNRINPTVSFIVLKSQINENKYRELLERVNQLKTPYVVISLYSKKILLEEDISAFKEEKIKEHSEVWQLGESKDPSAIIKLIEFTKSKNPNERRLAASGLGKLSKFKPQIYKACPDLIELLDDEKPQVRQYAAKALGKIGYVKALPHLRKLLDDEKYYVRKAAQYAIKRCKSK